MNIECAQNDFAKSLQLISRVATERSSLPILANICLTTEKNKLKLSATDLEIGVTTVMRAKVAQEGSITLPARLLTEFISNNKDNSLSIKIKDYEAQLQSSRYKASISGIDSSDFPSIPSPGEDRLGSVKSDSLKKGLQDVLFATAVNDARPVLNGVLFDLVGEKLTLVATDSYRLSERIIDLPKGEKFIKTARIIVPAKAVAEIIRMLPDEDQKVDIFLNQNQVSFIFGETQLVARLIEGNYPEYKQIIPSGETISLLVNKNDFIEALKVSDLFARDNSHNIKIKIEKGQQKGKFYIKAISSAVSNKNIAEIKAEISGEDIEIAFNAKFILDSLSSMGSEMVTIKFFDLDRPMVICPTNDNSFLNLVMPLRVD